MYLFLDEDEKLFLNILSCDVSSAVDNVIDDLALLPDLLESL